VASCGWYNGEAGKAVVHNGVYLRIGLSLAVEREVLDAMGPTLGGALHAEGGYSGVPSVSHKVEDGPTLSALDHGGGERTTSNKLGCQGSVALTFVGLP
jgi:hypothetical protein